MALYAVCTMLLCLALLISPAACSYILGISAANLQTAKDFSVRLLNFPCPKFSR